MTHIFKRIVALILIPALLHEPLLAALQPVPNNATFTAASTALQGRIQSDAISARLKNTFFGRFGFLSPSLGPLLRSWMQTQDREDILAMGLGVFAAAMTALAVFHPHFLEIFIRKPVFGSALALLPAGMLVWVLDAKTKPEIPNGRVHHQLIERGPKDRERTTDWHQMAVVMEAIVQHQVPVRKETAERRPIKKNDWFMLPEISDFVQERLEREGLPIKPAHDLQRLVDQLVETGQLRKGSRGQRYYLTVEPAVAAAKMGLVDHIASELDRVIPARGSDEIFDGPGLTSLLEVYGQVVETWRLSPTEARWPFLKAVALMDAGRQQELLGFIARNQELRERFPLVDSIWLMLTKHPGSTPQKNDWLKVHAPHLQGSTIWTVGAEGFYPAGGLGRVQQYHSMAMKLLAAAGASVSLVEPYYPDDFGPCSKEQPAKGLTWIREFEVSVGDKRVMADVFSYERDGVTVYMIKDRENWYTKKRYAYDRKIGLSAPYPDFTYFFNRAAAHLIHQEEEVKFNKLKEPSQDYHWPAVICNDGQSGLLPRIIRQEFDHSPYLRNGVVMMVTHTYNNRYTEKIDGEDPTSTGLAWADVNVAVSAIHRDEVAPRDEWEREIANTNGDDRTASRGVFLKIWKRLFGEADDEHPTAEQLRDVKETAKLETAIPREILERCGLDPTKTNLRTEQAVLGYFGRLVKEKAGLFLEDQENHLGEDGTFKDDPKHSAAFTPNNLRYMLQQGGQVVLMANVQPNAESEKYEQYLYNLAKKLNSEGHAGRLIVWTRWTLEDQRKMLAASDAQIQDSWRATEAAGYTESDISANGGLQIGPPYIEGIIQRQGLIIDRKNPGKGNTLIPRDESEAAWQDVFGWVMDKFAGDRHSQGRLDLAAYQATSVRLSRPLEAILPAAEYLRLLDAAFELKKNPLEAIRRWVGGDPQMHKYFRKPWVRRQLTDYLSRPDKRDIAIPVMGPGDRVQAFVITLEGVKPFLIGVDTDTGWWTPPTPYTRLSNRDKAQGRIPYKGNEEAFRILLGDAIDDSDAVFEFHNAAYNADGKKETFAYKHFIDDTKREGIYLQLPYPGVQVLTPVFLHEPLGRGKATTARSRFRGLPVEMQIHENPELKPERVYLSDVPIDVAEAVQDVFQKDSGLQSALAYGLRDRPPERKDGDRIIMQVPVRFLGDWGPDFLRCLVYLIFRIGLPEGSFIHLLAAYPGSEVSQALNNIERPHDVIDGRAGEFYKVEFSQDLGHPRDARVIIKNVYPGRPGQTSSYFGVSEILGNRPRITQTVKELHGVGMRALLDGTMHVSVDSPLILEHPEFFVGQFDWDAYPGFWLDPAWSDTQIMDRVGDAGFLVYAADPDGTMSQKLRAAGHIAWGETTLNGQSAVRFVLRHHFGLGPMSDTALFNENNEAFRAWYMNLLRQGIVETGADGYRFDLADRVSEGFMLAIKASLAKLGRELGKPLACMTESYNGGKEKQSFHVRTLRHVAEQVEGLAEYHEEELPLGPDVAYDNQIFEAFRNNANPENVFSEKIDDMIQFWRLGGVVHYLTNHDELTPLGKLGGQSQRPRYFAMLTLVFMLPGSIMFPWWEAFGWELWDKYENKPTDAKREWTYPKFLDFAAVERTRVLSQFKALLKIAHHAIFRDGHETLLIGRHHWHTIGAYARLLDTREYGHEMAVIVSNLRGYDQSDILRIPIEQLDRHAKDKLYMLQDRLHHRLYIYSGEELLNLNIDLAPWESRVYLVREIENPSDALRELIENGSGWPAQGILVTREREFTNAILDRHLPHLTPWDLSLPELSPPNAFQPFPLEEQPPAVKSMMEEFENLSQNGNHHAGASGIWKRFNRTKDWSLEKIGHVENGIILGVLTLMLAIVHVINPTPITMILSVVAIMGTVPLYLFKHHLKYGVVQPDGTVVHSGAAARSAAITASLSLLGLMFIVPALLSGSWVFAGLGIAAGVGLGGWAHGGVNWLVERDPNLTFISRLLPRRIAFRTSTVLALAFLSRWLFAVPVLPYMTPIRTAGNSLGIFYSPEQQLMLKRGHGDGDFVTSLDVVEGIADTGGDFFALWPYMMTTVNGSPYNVLAQNLLDPKKANVDAFAAECTANGSAVPGAFEAWKIQNEARITRTSKARRMPHDERMALNTEALAALWKDFQSQTNTPMSKAFQQFKRYAKKDLDEELTYLTLRIRHLAENGEVGWDWRTWKEQGQYRSRAVWLLRRKPDFKAEYERQLFIQFVTYRQLGQLKEFANSRGVEISVDKPVGMDGVTWNKKIFDMAGVANHRLETQGVKADYFERFGQYWQFWLQRAEAFLAYHILWIESLVRQGALVLRVDHALGFFRVQHWVEDAHGSLTWEALGLWKVVQEKRALARQAWEDNDESALLRTGFELRELYFRKLLEYWDDAQPLGMPKNAIQKIFKSRESTELAEDAEVLVWRRSEPFDQLVERAKGALTNLDAPDLEALANAFIGAPSQWTDTQRPQARKLAEQVINEIRVKGPRRMDEVLNKNIRGAYLLGAPWTKQNAVEQKVHHGDWGTMYLRITPTKVGDNEWDDGWFLNYLINDVQGPQSTDSLRPAYYVLGPGGRAIAAIEALAQRIGALIYYEFLGALHPLVDSFIRLLDISRLQPAIYYPFKDFGRRDVATYGLTDSHSIKKDWEEVRTREYKEEKLREWGMPVTEERLTTLTPEVRFHLLAGPMQSKARGVMYTVNDVLGLGEEARMNEPGAQSGQFEAGVPMYVEHFREAAKAYAEGRPIPMDVVVKYEADPEEYAFQTRSRQLAREYVEMMQQLRAIRPAPGTLADSSNGPALVDVVPSVTSDAVQLRVNQGLKTEPFQIDATVDGNAAYLFLSIRDADGHPLVRVPMRKATVERGVPTGRQVWRGQWPTRQVGHYTFQIEVADEAGQVLYRSDFGHLELTPKSADMNSLSEKFYYGSVDILRHLIALAHQEALTHSHQRGEIRRITPTSPSDVRYEPHFKGVTSAA